MRTLVIWGAGRIGRGFVAGLFHEPGWRIVFVDIDRPLVERLNRQGGYTVFRARKEGIERARIEGGFTALHTSETEALRRIFCEEGLMLDIAVHAPKLDEVADMVAPLFAARAEAQAGPMDVMMNVNMAGPDEVFLRLMNEKLSGEALEYFHRRVGVTGIAAMCISPVATEAMLKEDPLALLNNAWPEQAIGAPQLKGEPPALPHVRLSGDVHAEETRKLYTLNMAHALCCYLGVKKGCATVMDAMTDQALRGLVYQALGEAGQGLSRAFGFSREEMAGIFIAVGIFEDTIASTLVVGIVAFIEIAVTEFVYTISAFLVILPHAIVHITRSIMEDTASVAFVLYPLAFIGTAVGPVERAFAPLHVILPIAIIEGSGLKRIASFTLALIFLPLAIIHVTRIIVHYTVPLLIITEPQTLVAVIIGKVIRSFAVLLVLIPLAFILLAVNKRVNAIALTLTFLILSLIDIAISEVCLTLAMGLISKHFALIKTLIGSVTRS